jgi:hypothetical protein
MNDTLQTALAWFGGISALGYLAVGAWITAIGVHEARRIEAERRRLRARRTPITEAEINAVDFDAKLARLIKEDGR